MTEQLKQAAQQALEALKNVTDYDQINAARRALQAALTTSQPAQAGEQWTKTAAALNYYAHNGQWPTQPAAQATPDDSFVAISFRIDDISPEPTEDFEHINCQFNGIDGTAEARRVDDNTVDIGRVVAFAQARPEPSRGMIGMGAHALANELAQAVAQDDADPDGHDMSAGLFGPNVSAWLRKVATEYLSKPATPPQHAAGEPIGYVSPEALEELHMSGEPASIHHWRAREDFVAVYVRREPGAPDAISELVAALGPILAAVSTNDGDSMGHLDSDDKVLWTVSSSWSADVRVTLGDLRKIALAAAQAKGGE